MTHGGMNPFGDFGKMPSRGIKYTSVQSKATKIMCIVLALNITPGMYGTEMF